MVSTANAGDLARCLEADGYRSGAPPWVSPENLAIDRAACAHSRCALCGRRLSYRPFHRPSPASYVALAVCPCGHAEEF
jgi:hypothetical protein